MIPSFEKREERFVQIGELGEDSGKKCCGSRGILGAEKLFICGFTYFFHGVLDPQYEKGKELVLTN